MATANPTEGLRRPMGVMKKITTWYLVMAVLFIVLGVFAIIEPVAAGLGVGMLVGLLLVGGGVGHIVAAFRAGDAKHVTLQVLIAVVYLGGGIYFLTHVFMATETLTLLLGGIILAEGVLEVVGKLIRDDEKLTVFNEFYVICCAGIEAYEIQLNRQRQRLKPTKN